MKTRNTIGCAMLIAAFALCGCTDNQRARNWGGTATIDLEPGKKLVNATFKKDDIWLLTRAARAGETPETYEFVEDSSFGVMNGKVIIKERASK